MRRGSSERCNSVEQVSACTHARTRRMGIKMRVHALAGSQLDTYSLAIHAYPHSYVCSARLEHFLSSFDVVAAVCIFVRVCICIALESQEGSWYALTFHCCTVLKIAANFINYCRLIDPCSPEDTRGEFRSLTH